MVQIILMQESYFRKKYTLLIRKLKFEHMVSFMAIGNNSGCETTINMASQAILNEEITLNSFVTPNNEPEITLHICETIDGDNIEQGRVTFSIKDEKIVKPLSKEVFMKSFDDGKGMLEYKFINVQTAEVPLNEVRKGEQMLNNLIVRMKSNNRSIGKQESRNLIKIVNQKDEIISKLNGEVQRLILETRKLNKSLSKEKETGRRNGKNRSIELNVRVNPNMEFQNKQTRYEKEIEAFHEEIGIMREQLEYYENRQLKLLEEIQLLKSKHLREIELNEEAIKDIRKEIEKKYEDEKMGDYSYNPNKNDNNDNNNNNNNQFESLNFLSPKKSQIMMAIEEQKKKTYVDEQLAEHLRKIEHQKEKEKSRIIEFEMKKKSEREIQREKQKQLAIAKSQIKLHKNRSQDQKTLMREISHLQNEREILNDKILVKDEEIEEIVEKVKKLQGEVMKLEDENTELRRTKSALLKEMESFRFADKEEYNDIEEYENMILKERKEIQDEKLKAQIEDLKMKNRKIETELREKVQEKEMELMKLRMSEKSALREKEIYANKFKEIMEKDEGNQKDYLTANQKAIKYQTLQFRAKEMQAEKKELEENYFKIMKERTETQNQMKKLRQKLDERESEWVRLKSIEAQNQYYRQQTQKFEKANKKFESQYQVLKDYAKNIEHLVGKKPKLNTDETTNKQRQEKYKNQIRNRLQVLVGEVREMENKFYLQKIEILLTEKSSVIKKYARRLEEDKSIVKGNEEISQQARLRILEQKKIENIQLQNVDINEIDRKISNLKVRMKKEEEEQHDREKNRKEFPYESMKNQIQKLTNKVDELKKLIQTKQKEIHQLQQKNVMLESEIKQKSLKIHNVEEKMKMSTILLRNDREFEKGDDIKKSYLQQLRKSKEILTNKSYEEFKRMNNELMQEKKKIEKEMQNLRYQTDKERIDLNEKVRTKERETKRVENQLAALKERNEKIVAKNHNETENLRSERTAHIQLIRELKDEIRELTRKYEKKEKQIAECNRQIARLSEHLSMYQEAEKQLFREHKLFKQNQIEKQTRLMSVIKQKQENFRNIENLKNNEIEILKRNLMEANMKLESEVNDNILRQNQIENLKNRADNYDQRYKEKEEEHKMLQQRYDFDVSELREAKEELDYQNKTIQSHILKISEEIRQKQIENEELFTKIMYAQKKQQAFEQIKNEFEEKIKAMNGQKMKNLELLNSQDREIQTIQRSYQELKEEILEVGEENTNLKMNIIEKEKKFEQFQKIIHGKDMEVMQAKNQKQKIEIMKNNIEQKLEDYQDRHISLEAKYDQLLSKNEELNEKLKEKMMMNPASNSRNTNQLGHDINSKLNKSQNFALSHSRIPVASNRRIDIHKSSMKIDYANQSRMSHLSRKQSTVSIKKGMEEDNKNFGAVVENMEEMKGTTFFKKEDRDRDRDRDNRSISSKSNIEIKIDSDEEGKKSQLFHDRRDSGERSVICIDGVRDEEDDEMKMGRYDQEEENIEDVINENNEMRVQMQQMQAEIDRLCYENEDLVEQIQGLEGELRVWKNLDHEQSIQNDNNNNNSNNPNPSNLQVTLKPLNSIKQSYRKSTSFIGTSFRPSSININHEPNSPSSPKSPSRISHKNSGMKKVEELSDQNEQLKKVIVEKELHEAEDKEKIRELEEEVEALKESDKKYQQVLNEQMNDLQNQVLKQRKMEETYCKQINSLEDEIYKLEEKIEKMILEDVKKDETINSMFRDMEKLNAEIRQKDEEIIQNKEKLRKNLTNYEKLKKQFDGNKREFRKYEQQAELEILRLRESLESTENSFCGKNQQVLELGERYITLEQQKKKLHSEIQKEKKLISEERRNVQLYKDKYNQIQDEMKKYDSSRTGYQEKIGQLEMTIASKIEEIKQMTKDTAISYKKYQIKIQTEKSEHERTTAKLREREEQILNLKKELAHYNQVCTELEKEKSQLTMEIAKFEKQLRDIMKSYDEEIRNLQRDKENLQRVIQKKESMEQHGSENLKLINKEITKKSQEIKHLNFKIEEKERQLEAMKEKSRREIYSLNSQLQIKKNQLQKAIVQIERDSENYFSKECEFIAEKEKLQKREKQLKNKFIRYEEILKQLEQELMEFKRRPSEDQWEQVCFENELYKNRISQLENKVKVDEQERQEKIYTQFRKYKLSKESEIHDLEAEMERYSSKFEELEENNFVLKKDNDSLKAQMRNLMHEKMRIMKDTKQYEETIEELKQQIVFYKNKRADDLNRLLNESYE